MHAQVNCDTGRPAVASPDHFRQVAAALPLSPEQRQQLRSAFQVGGSGWVGGRNSLACACVY